MFTEQFGGLSDVVILNGCLVCSLVNLPLAVIMVCWHIWVAEAQRSHVVKFLSWYLNVIWYYAGKWLAFRLVVLVVSWLFGFSLVSPGKNSYSFRSLENTTRWRKLMYDHIIFFLGFCIFWWFLSYLSNKWYSHVMSLNDTCEWFDMGFLIMWIYVVIHSGSIMMFTFTNSVLFVIATLGCDRVWT
jgi:hypothetical protein